MKFNSQWNFGKRIHKWLAASITSCTRDCCFWKLGWSSRICLPQQRSDVQFFHLPHKPSWRSPCSTRTAFMPFAILGFVEVFTLSPNPIRLCLDTWTVLGLCLDFAQTFFGRDSCQTGMSSLSWVLGLSECLSGVWLDRYSYSPRTVWVNKLPCY